MSLSDPTRQQNRSEQTKQQTGKERRSGRGLCCELTAHLVGCFAWSLLWFLLVASLVACEVAEDRKSENEK